MKEDNLELKNEQNCNCQRDPDENIVDPINRKNISSLSITGNTELIEMLLKKIIELSSIAEKNGLTEESKVLSSLIPDFKIMKVAQYEGFQNYWIANGRSFEQMFKNKIEQEENKLSFQEAWFETLQEYADSLLSEQNKFIQKSIRTAQYEGSQNHWIANSRAFELSFKKKLEKYKHKNSDSFTKAWFETLEEFQNKLEKNEFIENNLKTASKKKDNFIDEIIKDASLKNITITKVFKDWNEMHKDASRKLINKIGEKVESGISPGVAFYETIDYFYSGSHARNTLRKCRFAVNNIRKSSILKKAGLWDNIRSSFREWSEYWSDLWRYYTSKSGTATASVRKINRISRESEDKIKFMERETISLGGVLDPKYVENNLNTLLVELRTLKYLLDSKGSSSKLPPMPELIDQSGLPNPKYYNDQLKGIGPDEWDTYKKDLGKLILQIEGAAKQFDVGQQQGVIGVSSGIGKEGIILNAVFLSIAKDVGRKLDYISARLGMPSIGQKIESSVKFPPKPWNETLSESMEESSLGLSGFGHENEFLIQSAASNVTSKLFDLIKPFVDPIIAKTQSAYGPTGQGASTSLRFFRDITNYLQKAEEKAEKAVSDAIKSKIKNTILPDIGSSSTEK